MISGDPMTMTDEEMVAELLDVVRLCKRHPSMTLSLAEAVWALRQYRRAELSERYLSDHEPYTCDADAWDKQHPNWPEEARD